MGHTFLCVLSLFLLNTHLYGNTKEHKPRASVTADRTVIPAGDTGTLTCSVDDSEGWKYDWFRQTSWFSTPQTIRGGGRDTISISEGGIYYCRGKRGNSVYSTEKSDTVTIEKTVSNRATVTLDPNWPLIYTGETVTVRCEIQGGGRTKWTYEWKENNLLISKTQKEHRISKATLHDSGEYSCRGKMDFYSSTEWSNDVTLTVSEYKPRASVTADRTVIPTGDTGTLTCSVDDSEGWKYDWFRQTSWSSTPQTIRGGGPDAISISEGGIYYCRGRRGNSVYYTENSYSVTIKKTVSIKAVVTQQHNWPQIFRGEMINLTCEIQGGGDTEWDYEWTTNTYEKIPKYSERWVFNASGSSGGNYWCRGKDKINFYSSTAWSDPITLTVLNKPRPVLTVSPSWLSPGASVTLSCEVEHPSAGWRFYWYKTVPDLSDKYYRYYRYELLPGKDNGTEQNSSIIHGQTHTAGYVCRAGRGDSVYYTDHSGPKFVWSGDVHPSASLTVNPDRVQHFTSDSVSLSCEGNSTEWTVRRFPDGGFLSHCYHWGTMTGSTCKFSTSRSGTAVYWCESGSGEFSNSVNITVHNTDIILVSPVHPVTEGESVTVGCKLRSKNFVSSVFFYQNDKLRQNDTRQELNISAVSKSDEGFYKCQSSGKVSPQSWLTVNAVSKHESSSLPVALTIGLVCGILLIIFLLFYHFRQSKDSCFIRQMQSDSTSRDSSTNHGVNRNEKEHNEYCSLLRGESQEVTYSLIELKHIEKKCKDHKPEESPVYSDVKTETTGKSSAAATDESVYSEVKPGTAVGDKAAT
ncbi:Fc receptor-like protein 5 isoform X2 [Channa argus]|uniref:Fc receptor-like protein 5 isoform X2 n=1 Tax=Channa argus TaxID=215402 RepID=UPI00352219B1